MRVIDRYLARQLLTPLLFAFAAMTSIMLLNQIARRFGALVGKGLPWSVIGEVFMLCLPFIIAMTLPMAVLVAVLYSFSHLAADSEITALRASGVGPLQLVRPVLLTGLLLTAVNFWFTDQVLPRSNARLRNLLINIQRKKPTLELREQVINEIPPSGLFLRASRIDANTGRLRSVTIYDMGATDSRRIIYADSGVMGFTNQGTDLQMRLFDGAVHAFKQSDPSLMQVTDFLTNVIMVRDVSNRLDLEANDGVRGDREMSTCEMLDVVAAAEREVGLARDRRRRAAERDLQTLLGLPVTAAPSRVPKPPLPAYCLVFAGIGRKLGTAQPGPDAQRPRAPEIENESEELADAAESFPLEGIGPAAEGPGRRRATNLTSWAEVSAARDDIKSAGLRGDQYRVEVHKKWAISVACLVFSLVGIPMALRFPRGGMGLVIGGGLLVFAVYYVGLIAGEGLGNKNIVAPWIAMWSPNIIFAVLGVIGMLRVSRESGSTRGGDLAELWDTLTSRFRRTRPA